MNAAPCSWWQVTNLMELDSSASITSMFSSPGMPKMYSTPSFSRHLTRSSAALWVPESALRGLAATSASERATSPGAGMAVTSGGFLGGIYCQFNTEAGYGPGDLRRGRDPAVDAHR